MNKTVLMWPQFNQSTELWIFFGCLPNYLCKLFEFIDCEFFKPFVSLQFNLMILFFDRGNSTKKWSKNDNQIEENLNIAKKKHHFFK